MKYTGLESATENEIDRTVFLKALAHIRRREVLEALREETCPIELIDLAQRVVAECEGLDQTHAERLYISLYHQHIPRLEEAGLIEYDKEAKTVAITERATSTIS